jgi:hypothetical protein
MPVIAGGTLGFFSAAFPPGRTVFLNLNQRLRKFLSGAIKEITAGEYLFFPLNPPC